MSSVLSSFAKTPAALTKFVSIRSPVYNNPDYNNTGNSHRVLVPFEFKDGVLDLNEVPGFDANNTNMSNTSGESWRMVSMMGGVGVVTSLSEKAMTWFENQIDDQDGIDYGSLSMHIAPVMTKVKMSVPYNSSILNNNHVYVGYLDEPPSSNNFVTGSEATNWDTVWVFKTPLVLKYTYDGYVRYASFLSEFNRR